MNHHITSAERRTIRSRRERGIADLLFTSLMLMKKYLEFNKKLYLAFTDLEIPSIQRQGA